MEDKVIVLANITEELNPLLKNIMEIDKESDEYKILSIEMELLDEEIAELRNIKDMDEYLSNNSELISKYKVLESLDDKKVLDLINIYNNYFKGLKEFKSILNSNSNINLISDKDLKSYNLNFNSIKRKEDIDILLKIIGDKFEKFIKAKEKYLASTKNFATYKYRDLKEEIESGKILDKNVLKKYKGLGADSLINKICDLIEEFNNIYDKKFLNVSKDKVINKYAPRIDKYMKNLIMQIEDYIKKAFYLSSSDMDIEIEFNQDFLNFYYDIINEISEKEHSLKVLKRDLIGYKNLLEFNEKKFLLLLSKVGINHENLNDIEKEYLFNVDKSEVISLLSKLKLYNRICNLKKDDNQLKMNKNR